MATNYKHPKLKFAPSFSGAFLAGGALTSVYSGQPINDYDFYFKSEAALREAVGIAYKEGYWCAALTDRAVTFLSPGGDCIQFMLFDWFGTAHDIFARFDFRCNMAAVDCDDFSVCLHDHFLCDLAARRLTFNPKTDFPIASAARVKKYVDRGFTISRGSMLKVGAACASLEITSWADLKNQLGGVYGEQIDLADADGPFSWELAFDALDNADFIPTPPTEFPDSADAILASIFHAEAESEAA